MQGLDQVQLSQQQLDLLKQNGFAVAAPVASKYREFYQVYESMRYTEQPVFATTDAVFHVYHLVFDKMLRDLERDYFITDLEKLSSAMLAASQDVFFSGLMTMPLPRMQVAWGWTIPDGIR